MLIAFSLLSDGQASTTGLTSTSRSPPPTAYTPTEIRIPINGTGRSSGRTVRRISPAAEKICAAIIAARYPILSIRPTDRRSTRSWIPKLKVTSRVICESGIW